MLNISTEKKEKNKKITRLECGNVKERQIKSNYYIIIRFRIVIIDIIEQDTRIHWVILLHR